MTIYLITKNPGKIQAAKRVFDKYKIDLQNVEKEYPEIQAATSLEIARHTAIAAAIEQRVPVIREDHSFTIRALGLPGPYMNFIEKWLPAEKLLEVLKGQPDRSAYFEVATVYAEPDGKTKEFVFQVEAKIKDSIVVNDRRGGWNSLICLGDEKRALTEYPEEERLQIWSKNYEAIAQELIKNA